MELTSALRCQLLSRRRASALRRNLDAGLAELAQQGGHDPLPEMLQHAADAAQQAGPARGGRAVRWDNDSPAVQVGLGKGRGGAGLGWARAQLELELLGAGHTLA